MSTMRMFSRCFDLHRRRTLSATTGLFYWTLLTVLICRPMCGVARPTSELSTGHWSTTMTTDNDEASAIMQRLRLGDAEAWRRHGGAVLDTVEQIVKAGASTDPFDALLLFFYPNMSAKERRQTLNMFRPFLELLLPEEDRKWSVRWSALASSSSTSGNAKNVVNISDKLRLQILQRPSSASRPPQVKGHRLRFADDEERDDDDEEQQQQQSIVTRSEIGQKETPLYLGTHESPTGIHYRT